MAETTSAPTLASGLPVGRIGLAILLLIAVPCFLTLPWTLSQYDVQGDPKEDVHRELDANADGRLSLDEFKAIEHAPDPDLDKLQARFLDADANKDGALVLEEFKSLGGAVSPNTLRSFRPPSLRRGFGTDSLDRSLLARCLLGGAISLTIGCAAAAMAVVIGVVFGAVSGYAGGRTDALMMRFVDIMYGLPYILTVVLLAVAVQGLVDRARTSHHTSARVAREAFVAGGGDPLTWADPPRPFFVRLSEDNPGLINLASMMVAIGGASWLTLARVIRGQVLSLRAQPFIEAATALGLPSWRILAMHVLPNLVGPIVVYTTLTVPSAILQESFLSFLGIGVRPPLPTWGGLAADGLEELPKIAGKSKGIHWWLLVWPCVLLALTLVSLNFMGEAMRERFDPKSRKR